MTRRSPTCSLCRVVGHRAPTCPTRARPVLRPSGVRLPLYLRPLPEAGTLPPKHAPRAFEHVAREETHASITHRWRAPDGRTVTATGPKRPNDCASPAWSWEGLMVLRRMVDAEHVRHALPTFAVTEGP